MRTVCKTENELELRKEMEEKYETKDILTDNVNMKEYMKGKSLSKIRELFRIRTNMNEIKGNFKNDPRK